MKQHYDYILELATLTGFDTQDMAIGVIAMLHGRSGDLEALDQLTRLVRLAHHTGMMKGAAEAVKAVEDELGKPVRKH